MADLLHSLEEEGRKFKSKEIPLWVSVIFFILLAGISAGLFFYFRVVTVNYTLQVTGGMNNPVILQYGPATALQNSDYFTQVKNQFIAQKADFIEADLSSMVLRVHKSGDIIKEVPIKTKGREGSWWETPAGIYKIEAKESNHFSSIGHVYQPWSMVFQGNFFIHGWPYYSDGTQVASAYSGGCIRLSTPDAKAVYDLATVGMPVLVYEKDFIHDSFRYLVEPPDVTAERYLVADLASDSVLFEKDSTATTSIASITKLVTALVAAEYINLDNKVTITQSMIEPTSKPRLRAGQEVPIYDLLFPLLMESSNEASAALAHQLGSSYFVSLMNKKAKAMGMNTSQFADASGASGNNKSTAQDLFALAKYIYNNRSFVFKMSSGNVGVSAYGAPSFKNLQNFNLIPGATDQFVGGKIGKSTTAEETYLGVFNISIRGHMRPIVIILLGSDDVYVDAAQVLGQIHAVYQ